MCGGMSTGCGSSEVPGVGGICELSSVGALEGWWALLTPSHLSSPHRFQGENIDLIHPGTFLSPVSKLGYSQMELWNHPTQEKSQGWQGCSENSGGYFHPAAGPHGWTGGPHLHVT